MTKDLKLYVSITVNHYMAMEMTEPKKLNYHGLLKYHLNSCRDAGCFCKKNSTFDIQKNKMVDVERE